MLTVGSLFSGVGGFDLGLERAGFQVLWQVEIDDYANRVLAKHWSNVARFRDVRECGKHNLAPVDLICGGWPCQPHSLAGKRAASADKRDLWPEFIRIIRELRPRWVLGENVPGLCSSETGRFFGRVLRDLAECGLDAEWQVLPAWAFGAPHIRERVFIVAYPNGRNEGRRIIPEWGADRRDADTPGNGTQGDARDVAHSTSTGLSPESLARLRGRLPDGSGERGENVADPTGCSSEWERESHGDPRLGSTSGSEGQLGGTASGDVADPDGRRCNPCDQDSGLSSPPNREGQAVGPSGTRPLMADSPGLRCQELGRVGSGEHLGPQSTSAYLAPGRADVGDSDQSGQQGQGSESGGLAVSSGATPPDGTGSTIIRNFRRVFDGATPILDGSGRTFWSDGEWPGVPRTIVKQPNRGARLRCLGNAIVPQIAEYLGRCILAAEARQD